MATLYHEWRVCSVDDLLFLCKSFDVAHVVVLSKRMETKAWLIQEENQPPHRFHFGSDAIEPSNEAEEPDKALATLLERYRNSMSRILNADVEVFARVEGRIILRVR